MIKSEKQVDQQNSDITDHVEITEFETNCKLRGLPFNTCLQPEQITENQVISIAPGGGNKPIHFLTDKYYEEMANPVKYPYGSGGLSEERKVKLVLRRYFNQRILGADGCFSKDVDYMLAAQFVVESKQLEDQANTAIRQTKGRQNRNQNVTAGHLKDPEKLHLLVQTNDAYRLLKQVRGTPAYWQKVHYDVLAMVRQLGIPTWFLTLSAADMKWPDVIQIIARQYGTILTKEEVINMPWSKKSEW